jgi:hypothetical protein
VAETICPKCGFSPIPDRAETCPKCGENFAFHPLWKVAQRTKGGIDKKASIEMESTTFGGLTGEVSANPIPASIVTALCALVWLLRASGMAQSQDPQWLFAVAAAQLGAAAMLMGTIGPATMLVQLMGVIQMVIPFVVMGEGTGGLIVAICCALPGIAVLVTATGEPGPVRRNAGIVMGVVTFLVAMGAVFGLKPETGGGAVQAGSLGGGEGWDIRGSGYERLAKTDLAPHLTVPPETPRERHFGFGSRQKGVYGLVSKSVGGTPSLAGGCEQWLKAFGAVNEVQKVGQPPQAFGPESLLLAVKTSTGASGRFACGLRNGTLWGLTVVSSDPTATVGVSEFERAATGFVIQ